MPGSIIEQLKIVGPLTNPTAHDASASDAFHLVIPSLSGYGFSGKPTAPGWTPVSIARAWATLMQRLGYTRYVAQGGDWGNAVSEVMAPQQPPGLLGIHTNMAATVPADVSKALRLAARLRPACRPMKNLRGINSMISTSTALAMPRKCRTGHRRFTESGIRRSASPRGRWITTSAVTV
jgi:pimeloyl-ACP methyl ester carboxylesterase